jgi:hypothetical protein
LTFLVSGHVATAAENVAGSDDPDFTAATEIWLEGRDLEALERLSELASDGHVPSKILLSRIADTPKFSAHIAETLTRKERIALFREPKGLSGRDWLASAAEDNDLARALWHIQSKTPFERTEIESNIATLVSYGEIKPAFDYIFQGWLEHQLEAPAEMILENDKAFGAAGRYMLGVLFVSMAENGQMPPFHAGVNTIAKTRVFVDWLTSDLHEFAFSGSMVLRGLQRNPSTRDALAQAVVQLPELQPLTLFCETSCAASQQEICLAEGIDAVTWSGAFPFPFASPAQSLIDDATYWGSARFPEDVKRMVLKGGWKWCP